MYSQLKKLQQGKVECPTCGKVFKNDEYYEWHMWTQHQTHTHQSALKGQPVCLSDFCDILPCPRRKVKGEALLKRTMQVQRTTRDEPARNRDDSHRGLLDVYGRTDLMRLESRCSKLILDCIDWTKFSEFKMDPTDLYDMLYSIYCAKLTQDGHPKSYED